MLVDIIALMNIYNLHFVLFAPVYIVRLLSMLSHMKAPRRVLELGTFTGYATQCLAEGLAGDGKVVTIESDCNAAMVPEMHINVTELWALVWVVEEVLQRHPGSAFCCARWWIRKWWWVSLRSGGATAQRCGTGCVCCGRDCTRVVMSWTSCGFRRTSSQRMH